MINYTNNNDTAVVVLHEIYGLNQHIEEVCLQFSKHHMDVFAPNMLIGETVFDYTQENDAYNNFLNSVGFEKAFKQINTFILNLRRQYNRVVVVGYSVGATIAWLCSNEAGLCNAVIGFYGSRIRDYLEINPKCPVLLFFPNQEKSFNVSDLVQNINHKDNVCIKQLYGQHGFANPSSPNYNKDSSDQAYKAMLLFIKNQVENKIVHIVDEQ
ncbi:dienelactone hydrolase family protein [Desulfotomaculum defluvii]